MAQLEIRKKARKNFEHVYGDYKLTFSDLRIAFDGLNQNVKITRENGAFVIKREGFLVTDISVYDETGSGVEEIYNNVNDLANRLIAIGYIAFYTDNDIVIGNLISSDASNALTVGTDGLLYVPVGGGSINQDNIRIVKGFVTASSNFLDMVAGIDALATYTIADNELYSYQTSIVDENDPLNTSIITINTKNVGKGTYGVGGTSLAGNLWIVGTRRLSYGDAEGLPNTQVINLGAHTGTNVETVFNAQPEFAVQLKTTGLRLVNITLDTVQKQYFFTGVAGDYGVGGDLTAVTADFDEITGDVEPSDLSAYQLKPAEGAFVDGDKTKLDGIEANADVTDATNVASAGAVMKSDYTANSLLTSNATGTPTPLTVAPSTLVGRGATGDIKDMTVAEAHTMLGTKLDTISFVISAPDTDIEVGDTVSRLFAPYAFTLNNYWVSADVAPTGSSAIVRVKKNGTLADSVGASINSGANTSIGNNPTITTSTFAKGDKITPNISQIGSTIKGQFITLYLEILKT